MPGFVREYFRSRNRWASERGWRLSEVRAIVTKGVHNGTERQLEVMREALSQISARPIVTVMAELSRTRAWRQRRVLEVELAEAELAARLRDELVRLSATATKASVTATENPVTRGVATVTGRNPASIDLALGVGLAILLLVGAFLWVEMLRQHVGAPARGNNSLADATGPIAELRQTVRGRQVQADRGEYSGVHELWAGEGNGVTSVPAQP